MTNQQLDLTTRESILKLLSDEEVAQVSTAETAGRLSHGDEYVDLHHLEYGIRKAIAGNAPMEGVLPSKAIHLETWKKVVEQVDAYAASAPLGGV